MKFFALMLCASLVFAACDKEKPNDDKTPEHETPVTPPDEKPEEKPDDNPEEKPEDKPNEDNVQDLVIPDILFEGYYYGDYYEVGNGNAGVNFIEGSLGVDEYDEYVGTGTIVCLDLNFALPDDPDHALIPAGTYVMDEAGTAEASTWGLDESYIIKVVDGEAVYDYRKLVWVLNRVGSSIGAYPKIFVSTATLGLSMMLAIHRNSVKC